MILLHAQRDEAMVGPKSDTDTMADWRDCSGRYTPLNKSKGQHGKLGKAKTINVIQGDPASVATTVLN